MANPYRTAGTNRFSGPPTPGYEEDIKKRAALNRAAKPTNPKDVPVTTPPPAAVLEPKAPAGKYDGASPEWQAYNEQLAAWRADTAGRQNWTAKGQPISPGLRSPNPQQPIDLVPVVTDAPQAPRTTLFPPDAPRESIGQGLRRRVGEAASPVGEALRTAWGNTKQGLGEVIPQMRRMGEAVAPLAEVPRRLGELISPTPQLSYTQAQQAAQQQHLAGLRERQAQRAANRPGGIGIDSPPREPGYRPIGADPVDLQPTEKQKARMTEIGAERERLLAIREKVGAANFSPENVEALKNLEAEQNWHMNNIGSDEVPSTWERIKAGASAVGDKVTGTIDEMLGKGGTPGEPKMQDLGPGEPKSAGTKAGEVAGDVANKIEDVVDAAGKQAGDAGSAFEEKRENRNGKTPKDTTPTGKKVGKGIRAGMGKISEVVGDIWEGLTGKPAAGPKVVATETAPEVKTKTPNVPGAPAAKPRIGTVGNVVTSLPGWIAAGGELASNISEARQSGAPAIEGVFKTGKDMAKGIYDRGVGIGETAAALPWYKTLQHGIMTAGEDALNLGAFAGKTLGAGAAWLADPSQDFSPIYKDFQAQPDALGLGALAERSRRSRAADMPNLNYDPNMTPAQEQAWAAQLPKPWGGLGGLLPGGGEPGSPQGPSRGPRPAGGEYQPTPEELATARNPTYDAAAKQARDAVYTPIPKGLPKDWTRANDQVTQESVAKGPNGSGITATARNLGQDVPYGNYLQELAGTQSASGLSNELIAMGNKNIAEGRMGDNLYQLSPHQSYGTPGPEASPGGGQGLGAGRGQAAAPAGRQGIRVGSMPTYDPHKPLLDYKNAMQRWALQNGVDYGELQGRGRAGNDGAATALGLERLKFDMQKEQADQSRELSKETRAEADSILMDYFNTEDQNKRAAATTKLTGIMEKDPNSPLAMALMTRAANMSQQNLGPIEGLLANIAKTPFGTTNPQAFNGPLTEQKNNILYPNGYYDRDGNFVGNPEDLQDPAQQQQLRALAGLYNRSRYGAQ